MEQLGIDFWTVHGWGFIFCMCLFPRLTMLFTGICSMVFSGPLFWVGWVFAPRITVALIASLLYFNTNPIVCVFAWLWALGGESSEKRSIHGYYDKD